MFKDSKVYKNLYEVYRVVDMYEHSCKVLEQSRGMVEKDYPRCAKKEDLRLDFNNVKGKVDSIKDKSKDVLASSESLLSFGEDFMEHLELLIVELKSNITRIDENIGRFVAKYELIDTTDDIKPKKVKTGARTILTDKNIKGLIFGDTSHKESSHKKRSMAVALVDEELRKDFVESKPKRKEVIKDHKEEEPTKVVEMSEESKNRTLERYRRNRIESLRRFNLDTTEVEKQLEEVKSTPAKPKLTKGQIKKLTSPFRNKMSACHKYYNETKGNLTDEGIVDMYDHAVAILHEFGNVKDYLNNVDLDELNALLKRLDKLSLVKPGLLSYDFSEYRVQIEECKRSLLNK